LFSRLNRKRRASAAANIIQKEPRIEDPFAAALASAGQDTGFQFEDTGYDYTDTGFDDMGRFDTVSFLRLLLCMSPYTCFLFF
jgi:hypothetical protein